MDKKDLYQELDLELSASRKEINELNLVISRLKDIIIEHGMQDEIPDIDCTSTEELICINGIRHISQLVEAQDYDDKDIKNFDTLLRSLRTIRGHASSKTREKPLKNADIKNLVSIVKNHEG